MKVTAYCGHYKLEPGELYIFREPPECCWEAIIEVDDDEWHDECVSIECPECGAELWQTDAHFEVLKETGG